MGKAESKIESHLDERVVSLGGFTRKWVSPGRRGVLDRIVFLPGEVWFVELKTLSGQVSKLQYKEMERISNMGGNVAVLNSKTKVDYFIKCYLTRRRHET